MSFNHETWTEPNQRENLSGVTDTQPGYASSFQQGGSLAEMSTADGMGPGDGLTANQRGGGQRPPPWVPKGIPENR